MKKGRVVGNRMNFNEETVRRLRGLIVFTVAVVVVGVNYQKLLATAGALLKMLAPFLLGGAIAFALNVPMRFLENRLWSRLSRKESRYRRPVCLILAIAGVVGALTVVMVLVVPELFRTIMTLERSIPQFFANVQQALEGIFADYPEIETYISSIEIDWKSTLEQIVFFLGHGAGTVLSTTVSAAVGIVNGVATFCIGFVFALYILLQKENLARQAGRFLQAFLPEKGAAETIRVAKLVEKTFSSFLTGQCLEAMILGSMFFVTLTLLQMPYALLIGVLIAFTALIPIFGAFVGCAVGAFLILLVSPVQALVFIVVFQVLQQIEGNLIYPHVVGESVGLPSIWVLAAVTIGGNLMGIVGMLVFIPLLSVVYTIFRKVVYQRLKKRHIKQVTATDIEEYTEKETASTEK